MKMTARKPGQFLCAVLAALLILAVAPSGARAGLLDEVDLHGFWDNRAGLRLQDDAYQRRTSLLESRLQLEGLYQGDVVTWQVRGDFVADDVTEEHDVDLEEGSGWFDLREANLLVSPTDWLDLKVGRQILTWGTGDLLFLNDLFPKDWQAFFIGRDVEYLKAPSDALLASFYPEWGTIDLVYTPRFDPDRFIRGERISYYNPLLGRTAGRDAPVRVDERRDWFDEDEFALRVSRNIGSFEAALYGYLGYWKSPAGFDAASGRNTFPRLNVWGASLRGPVADGIGNLELAWYDSRDDAGGDDPLLPNSEGRLLLGYERELARDFTIGLQYYLERLLDYDAYRRTLPAGTPKRDENRHLLTLRLTRLLLNQNLTLSLFAYYSPSDEDAYLRPSASYKLTDSWQLSGGGNIFAGRRDHTFFGQFEEATNVYAAIRYSF
ncbi:hypothetical protein EDC39_1229 [Geothermobacter ehrlichii]|uniref:Beta-barrel porin 2 n=2 Tax=Geothermobacter ehrlichii TaxID=213224 RepID=A0A5D3WEA0_9BACT|nr:hypothetical protein EDC39_1229 [Geothermobacter ehrlichii]